MASPFRPALQLLQQYADYHRDRRNIATHLVGVPLIVFGLGVLLARGGITLNAWHISLATLVFVPTALWYLSRGHLGVGLATALAVGALIALAHRFAHGSLAHWLAWGLGSFGVGWVIQFVGHYYEGRKPAFVDDVVGLLVGPMFVVLELGAMLGLFKDLSLQVEQHAGPTVLRDLAQPATR